MENLNADFLQGASFAQQKQHCPLAPCPTPQIAELSNHVPGDIKQGWSTSRMEQEYKNYEGYMLDKTYIYIKYESQESIFKIHPLIITGNNSPSVYHLAWPLKNQ